MAKTVITNLHDMVASSAASYIHANKEEFRSSVPGPQGLRGIPGIPGAAGIDGDSVTITSVLNNINKSLTINFSDGTQHTTDPLKGEDGRSITITNVVNNANGTMLINFSDGTSHHTADLRGPRGFKGNTGDHVHHISYQRSKDSLGNEVGPVAPSQKGHTDIYAMWASQEELPEMYIGEFTVYNGLNSIPAVEQAKLDSVEFGATADQEAFEVPYDNTTSGLLSEDVQNSIDELSATKLNILERGQPNGVAELDANGLVPSEQLPSYVDDVIEVETYADLPVEGERDKIYVVVTDENEGGDTNTYRWTGSTYALVSNTLTANDIKNLYESNDDTNAYADWDKNEVDTIQSRLDALNEELLETIEEHTDRVDNPHEVTKAQVGLGNADNTADVDKIVASAGRLTEGKKINDVVFDNTQDITITANTPNSSAISFDSGTDEGTDVYTFDGSEAKSVDIVAGLNVELVKEAGKITINTGTPDLDASKITSGIIDAARLPSYVEDVLEFPSFEELPEEGETGKIYITLDTNKAYRWSGTVYIYITSGAVDSVAGKTGVVLLNKNDVGLDQVDNTSDLDKPISTATQSQLGTKALKTTRISAGIGLEGGGDLSTNRTLSVKYGTIAGTSLQGNALVTVAGQSDTVIMSQKAVTNYINSEYNKSEEW